MEDYKIINAAILNTIMVFEIDSPTEKCHPILGDGRAGYVNQEPAMSIIERTVKGLKRYFVIIDRDEHGNGSIGEGGTIMTSARFRELQTELGDKLLFMNEVPQSDEVI